MLVASADYVRPTDSDYAFALQPWRAFPLSGARTDIRHVWKHVLGDSAAERFERRVLRWGGPEDVNAQGRQPYAQPQLFFEEQAWSPRVTALQVEGVLEGRVLVLRHPQRAQVDYVVRDHHMLDVAAYHWATTQQLPRQVFHADRHSDWADDAFLRTRAPDQAATWWSLFHGLKRVDGTPVLREQDIQFFTARPHLSGAPGREVRASARVPGFLDPGALDWAALHQRLANPHMDWVSLDLDCFQPSRQLRATRHVLASTELAAWLRDARVRVFCLSPQFTRGGDRHKLWTVQGSRHSSLRLINLLRV